MGPDTLLLLLLLLQSQTNDQAFGFGCIDESKGQRKPPRSSSVLLAPTPSTSVALHTADRIQRLAAHVHPLHANRTQT